MRRRKERIQKIWIAVSLLAIIGMIGFSLLPLFYDTGSTPPPTQQITF